MAWTDWPGPGPEWPDPDQPGTGWPEPDRPWPALAAAGKEEGRQCQGAEEDAALPARPQEQISGKLDSPFSLEKGESEEDEEREEEEREEEDTKEEESEDFTCV